MKNKRKLSLLILAMIFALSVALLSACAPTKYELLLNDGLGNANSIQTTEINKDEEYTLPQMTQTRTGYVFEGWKRGSDGTVFNAGDTVKITGHTSFAAQWKGNSYTIVFHFDQDSQITSEQKMTYGTAALLNQNQFTKTGFDFVGWQDEDGNAYTDKQQVNNLTPEKNGTFDLWAIWEVKKYDLTLVFDNGEENLTTKYAFEADISGITDPDKEGYTFAGWYESETFEGDEYLLGTMPANNMTLYAKWEINSYDITFVLNNGEDNKVVSYDFGANTSEITRPEKLGYTFGGWYDNEACTGTPYIFGTMPAKNVTLYAKWTVNSYTITFVKNNGESNTSVPYNFGATTSALDSVNKEGYTFAGWYESASFSGEPYAFGTMPAKNVTLYAKWNINSYTITFIKNNGEQNEVVTYNFGEKVSEITPINEGYTFGKWYESETFAGDPYVFGTMPARNVTLYAKWTINPYTLTLVKNNGEANVEVIYDFDEQMNVPSVPNKEGHTFAGWYENQNFEGEQYAFGTMPAHGVTLYAKWTVNSYDITFVLNNGEENATVSYDFGTNTSAIADPEKEGFTFAGWYDNEACSGSPYVFGNMPAHGVMLYAKWDVNSYTITFVKNNGEENVIASYDFGAETAEIERPEKVGYTFGGWYDNEECTGTPYIFGTMPAHGITLYAKWNINSYTITFVDGSETLSSTDYQYDEMPVAPKMPSQKIIDERTIAVFKGWSPAVVAATATQTYTAVWENQPRLYGITFEENEFVNFYTADGSEEISTAQVEFENSFSFTIKKNVGVYVVDMKVYCNGNLITAVDGVYTAPFNAEGMNITVSDVRWVEYEVTIEASRYIQGWGSIGYTATYLVEGDLSSFTYGKQITIYAVGTEWFTDSAPVVTYGGREIEPLPETQVKNGVTYFVYEIIVTQSGTILIDGVADVIPVTYVDLNGKETVINWNAKSGDVSMIPQEYFSSVSSCTSNYGEESTYSYTIIYSIITTEMNGLKLNTIAITADADSANRVSDKDVYTIDEEMASLLPVKGGENVFYLCYNKTSRILTDTVTVKGFVLPGDATDVEFYADYAGSGIAYEGSFGNKWLPMYNFLPDAEGNLNLFKPFTSSAQQIGFTPGVSIYVRFTSPDGTLPTLKGEDGSPLEAQSHTIGSENVLCYKIVAGEDQVYSADATFYSGNFVLVGGNAWINSSTRFDCTQTYKMAENGSFSFYASQSINSDITDKFELQGDGTYLIKEEFANQFVKITGDVKYSAYIKRTFVIEPYYTYYLYITIYDVKSDFSVAFSCSPMTNVMTFELSEEYDIFANGVLLEDDNGDNKVSLTVFNEMELAFVLKDDKKQFDWYIEDDLHLVNGSLVYISNGGEITQRITTVSDDGKSVHVILNDLSAIDEGTTVKVNLPPIVNERITAHYDTEKTQAADSDFVGGVPMFGEKEGNFEFKLQLSAGQYPVLYVEYQDVLSDGYLPFTYTAKTENGSENTFTFSVPTNGSALNWYVEIKNEVYEITIHYGENTDVVNLEFGTRLSDCDLLPKQFEGTKDGTHGVYKISGWSKTNGGSAILQVDSSTSELWAVLGAFQPAEASFNGTYYLRLEDALTSLTPDSAGNLDLLYDAGTITLDNGEYTIPSGVVLRLPYANESYGRKLGDKAADNPSMFYAAKEDGFTSLVLGSGVTLKVYGTIDVGGIVGYPQTAYPYQGQTSAAHAILQADGDIDVMAGGVLDVNGYVVGNGTVTLFDGAFSKLPFVVKDYRGGTNSMNVYLEGYAPFNIYEMPNIQTNYVIHYGASEMAYAMLFANEAFNETIVEAIGKNGIIRLNEGGYVVKKTTEIANPRYSEETKAYEPQFEFRTTIDVYGGGRDGAMQLDVGLVTVTTEGAMLAIPYTYEISLHDGDYVIYNMYKIMPGASLTVAQDATLEITNERIDNKDHLGSIVVYDENFKENHEITTTFLNSKQLWYPSQPNGVAEGGKFIINGKLYLYGNFAGNVSSDIAGAYIEVSLSAGLEISASEAISPKNKPFTIIYSQDYIATINETTTMSNNIIYTSGAGGVWA